MNLIFKISIMFILLCFSSVIVCGRQQNIILTGSQKSGSYIFANELARLWASSITNRKVEFVIHPEFSPKNRLKQLENNRVKLAIIDAATAHKELKKHPGIRVLTVLWENWLHVLGTVPGPILSVESTQTLLVHDNSFYFAQVWNDMSPQTKINWFNIESIPDFSEGFSEEVMVFTAPAPLKEVYDWLDQFPGIQLLSIDHQLIHALQKKFTWIIKKRLPPNTYVYQTANLHGVSWYPVLVVRNDFSQDRAKKLLNLIFLQNKALNPNVLFKSLLMTDNIAFKNVYNYHTASKIFFRFK